MKIRNSVFALALAASFAAASGQTPISQRTPAAASAPTAIPALVPFSGFAVATDGKPLTGEASITFLIYKDETGGEPLWTETQTTTVDLTGHYKVQLGAANPNGLPSDLFATGEARWLEIQIAGEAPQPRILLASVPYALKAADAATLGGLPASAFALAGEKNANTAAVEAAAITPDAISNVTTTGGASGYLPVFTGASTVGNSILYSSFTGLGIGDVPNSSAIFDVNGKSIWRGLLNVARAGNATASSGYDSFPMYFQASAYNSSSKTALLPAFQLQAEPTGNNTPNTGATFNLLYNSNTGTPTETGLYFNDNGTIHFANGQTFGATSSGGVAFNGTSTSSTGVEGTSNSGDGVVGQSTSGNGLHGVSTRTSGILGETSSTSPFDAAVYAYSHSDAAGVIAGSAYGEGGTFTGGSSEGNGIVGVVSQGGPSTGGTSSSYVAGGIGIDATGGSGNGAYANGGSGGNFIGGFATDSGSTAGDGAYFAGGLANSPASGGDGIYAVNGYAFESDGGTTYATAGTFVGDIVVEGAVIGDVKDFRIDHPSDPGSKYLAHASVESSEMMNIYTGNATTDELGLATVTLPGWFQILNTDFRYQLTVIGGRFAQAIVSKEIEKNQFTISTNAAGVKVSWQVTAVRQDAYAKAHPLVVEQTKPANQQGFYIHPELYGQPKEKQLEWGRNPAMMRHLQATREAQKASVKSPAPPSNAKANLTNASR